MIGDIFAISGLALTATVLIMVLKDGKKEFALVLTLITVALLFSWGVMQLSPILSDITAIIETTSIGNEHQEALFKALAIAFVTQLAGDCCRDAGEGAIASKVELCGKIAIMLISLPLIKEILEITGALLL